MEVTKVAEILEKVKFKYVNVSSGAANVFASDISETHIRNIFQFFITGKGKTTTLEIKKVEEDDTTTDLYPNINVGDLSNISIGDWDPLKSVVVLEGGTNLQVKCGTSSVGLTVLYWDSIVE